MHPETIHIIIGFIITLVIIIPMCHACMCKPMRNAHRKTVKTVKVAKMNATIRKW